MTEQARIYGKVLYELQIPEHMVQETGRIFKENPQLTTLLNDPTVQAEKKKNIIGKIWKEPDFSPLISSFLKKACESGCIGEIEDILTVWNQCVLAASGILKAKLIYVTEPDHEQLEGIQSFLCKEFHKKTVQLSMEEDQKLLGGFILKAEDMEYQLLTESNLYVNEKVAENLGITVPDSMNDRAVETFSEISEG